MLQSCLMLFGRYLWGGSICCRGIISGKK
jgi:hypothetical protein